MNGGYPGLPTVALNGVDMTDASCGQCIVMQGTGTPSVLQRLRADTLHQIAQPICLLGCAAAGANSCRRLLTRDSNAGHGCQAPLMLCGLSLLHLCSLVTCAYCYQQLIVAVVHTLFGPVCAWLPVIHTKCPDDMQH